MVVNIQLLRFLAALVVVFHHVHGHVLAAGGPVMGLFWPFSLFGYAGVDVFFVISGFVIWHTTKSLKGWNWSLDFAYRRATRIYTGYWPYFLMMLALLWYFSSRRLETVSYLDSFFLLPSPIVALVLPVSWTLTYELYFYALFALLLLLPAVARLWLIIGALVAVLGIQGIAWLHLGLYESENFTQVSRFYTFYTSPFLIEFLAGCLLAWGWQRVKPSPWILAGIFLILAALGIWFQEAVIGQSLGTGNYRPYRVMLLGGAAYFLVWWFLALEQRGVQLFPRYAVFLGAISYSLYLCHGILLGLFFRIGVRDWIASQGFVEIWYLALSLVIVGYSALHYLWIEDPLRNLSRRFRARYLAIWLKEKQA